MKFYKNPQWRKYNFIIILLLVISLVGNIYLFLNNHKNKITNKPVDLTINADQTIKDIEMYLDKISPEYISDEKFLAKQKGIPSWGCGPSSYALAKILNKKFFDNNLAITASYNDKNQYQIIQRFSLAQNGENKIGDHSWLEIYFGNKFLFIDPSIGQFGKINTIAYQVFNVGDPKINDILKNKYNIIDVRLSLLIPKVINRIPVEQEPYPGMIIEESSIDYFLRVLDDRNDINKGIEPSEWNDWVAFLVNKYSSV